MKSYKKMFLCGSVFFIALMIIWCVSKQNKLIIEGHGGRHGGGYGRYGRGLGAAGLGYGLGRYYGYGGYGGGDGGGYSYFNDYYPYPVYVYDDDYYPYYSNYPYYYSSI